MKIIHSRTNGVKTIFQDTGQLYTDRRRHCIILIPTLLWRRETHAEDKKTITTDDDQNVVANTSNDGQKSTYRGTSHLHCAMIGDIYTRTAH